MDEVVEIGEIENSNEENIDWQNKVQELEAEKKRIRDEFNNQRAKMKDLFLQKENELLKKADENSELSTEIHGLRRELDEAKSQLVVTGMTLESNIQVEKRKAKEEIASLQQFVQETIEESSTSKTRYDSEVVRMHTYIQQLQNEIIELKKQSQQSPHHSQQEHSLTPSVLTALTKGIVKKLGADSFSSQESVEDNIRKPELDYCNEDPEVLRSLVEPLEDQIKALKEKLRSTDEKLQKCNECCHLKTLELSSSSENPVGPATEPDSASDELKPSIPIMSTCDMCSNYEAQLVNEQKNTIELKSKVVAAEKAAERHKEELLKEIGFRKEMEEKWNEKREELKQQVAHLTRSTECAEQDLKELRQFFEQTYIDLRKTMAKLTEDREKIHRELETLQQENNNLVGKYTIHSQDLQSEVINLPNTVEELHELILKNHQDLIIAKIGKEAAEVKVDTLESNIQLLKDQIIHEEHAKIDLENNLVQEINMLKAQSHHFEKEKKRLFLNQEKMENADKINATKIMEMERHIVELQTSKKQQVELNNELSNRVSSLQQELYTSESVQKDFVLLSQSLQVQLEKIRGSDTQVRWQHEDDVNECPACHSGFSNTKRKQHCRHCGHIFCQQCLTRNVNSGPNMRPAKVCDVCHTLLVQTSAPYFSETPPTT